jgi:hypothetical protein
MTGVLTIRQDINVVLRELCEFVGIKVAVLDDGKSKYGFLLLRRATLIHVEDKRCGPSGHQTLHGLGENGIQWLGSWVKCCCSVMETGIGCSLFCADLVAHRGTANRKRLQLPNVMIPATVRQQSEVDEE